MESPLFTVIVPTYNRLDLCKATIESVLNQSYQNFELLVIDDGSCDGTKEYFKEYSHSKLTYIYQANSGVSAARNNGISHSKGDYICYLDSDDVWDQDKLKRLEEIVTANPDGEVIFHDFVKHDIRNSSAYELSNSETFPYIYRFLSKEQDSSIWRGSATNVLQLIVRGYPFYPSALTVKKGVHDQYLWDPGILKSEDFNFVLKLSLKYNFIYFDDVLTTVKVHDNNKSKDSKTKDTVILNTLNAFNKLYLDGTDRSKIEDMISYKTFKLGKDHFKSGNLVFGLKMLLPGLLSYKTYRYKRAVKEGTQVA